MSRKTRKLIWSAPLVAAFAVVGALALFAALAPGSLFADDALGKPNLMQPEAEGPRSIKLVWTAPMGESPMGYRIDVSKQGHVWTELVASQTETEYVHTLTESEVNKGSDGATTDRYYRVYALNSHGPGQESEIKAGTTKGVNVPEPVETITISSGGPNEVDVTWEPPTDNGGMSITGYTVLCKTDNTFAAADLSSASAKKVGADSRSHTREKLDADTTYFCRVFANNGVGPSGSGAVKSVTTDKAGRPGAPTNVVALQSDDEDPTSAINLYWLQPESDGGRDITHYIVEYKYNNEAWRTVTEEPLSVDATDGDSYPTGDSGTAAEIDYVHTIPADRDGDATNEPARVEDDTIKYRVFTRHEDSMSRASGDASVTLISIDTSTDPPEMDPRPAAPTAVTAAAGTTPGTIDLSWTHTVRTGYRIDVSENGMHWDRLESSTNLKIEFQPGGLRRYIHTGLLPGATRYYRVLPSDGGRYGIAGDIATASAGSAVAPIPVARNSFTATPVSPSQINLSWAAPTGRDTGGRTIRRYLLEFGDSATLTDPDLPAATVDDFDATANPAVTVIWVSGTSYQHKGLAADERYYYRVRADNSAADGTPFILIVDSNEATATLTSNDQAALATAKTAKIAAPGAPHSLSTHEGIRSSAGDIGEQGVYLTWLTAKSGGPAEEYELVRVVADEDDLVVSIEASGTNARTFFNDDDSQASLDNKARRYRLRAVNEAGESRWTDWVTYPLDSTHTHNVAPTAVGTIAAQTVSAGDSVTVDVAANFSDADAGDTLTYTAMSDMTSYATVSVSGSVVTITGVAAGSATITVTATDGNGGMASQMFMVTVEAADTTPGAPMNVMAMVEVDDTSALGTVYNVKVEWTDGANAEAHGVLLFTSDFSLTDHISRGLGGSHTFENVAAGSYIAVVVVLDAQGGLVTDANGDYLYAGAESTVTVQQ